MTSMTKGATAHRIEQLLDIPAKRVACHLPTNHSYEVMLEIPGAGVELRGAAPRRLQHTVGVRLRNGGCAVGAATVHHDELGTARAPWGERLQARGEGSGLVERGHHDGERLHADSSRSRRVNSSSTVLTTASLR